MATLALGLSPIGEPDWPSWWPRGWLGGGLPSGWKAPEIGNGTNLIALGNTADVLTGTWVEGGGGDPALDGAHDAGWFSRVGLWEVTGIPALTPTGTVPISFDIAMEWSGQVGPIAGECLVQMIGDQRFTPGPTVPVNHGQAHSVWTPRPAMHDGSAVVWDHDPLHGWVQTTVDWSPPPGTLPTGNDDSYHADYRLNTDGGPGCPAWNGRLFLAIAPYIGWAYDDSYPPPLVFDAWQTWSIQVRNLRLGSPTRKFVGVLAK